MNEQSSQSVAERKVEWTTAEERIEAVVSRIWCQFVGVPAVGAFASEHEWLKDQITALDRAAFTMGMREIAKQFKPADAAQRIEASND